MYVGRVIFRLVKGVFGHSVLLEKLVSYGVFGPELSWFTDYLFNRSQYVEQKTYFRDSLQNIWRSARVDFGSPSIHNFLRRFKGQN